MCACCVLTGLALLYLLVDSCHLHLEALREAQLVLQLDIRDRLLIKYTGGEEEGVVVETPATTASTPTSTSARSLEAWCRAMTTSPFAHTMVFKPRLPTLISA